MKRTVSLKLLSSSAQGQALEKVQAMFASACNSVVRYASENKCNNNVALHHLCYYSVRKQFSTLGSQMVRTVAISAIVTGIASRVPFVAGWPTLTSMRVKTLPALAEPPFCQRAL